MRDPSGRWMVSGINGLWLSRIGRLSHDDSDNCKWMLIYPSTRGSQRGSQRISEDRGVRGQWIQGDSWRFSGDVARVKPR